MPNGDGGGWCWEVIKSKHVRAFVQKVGCTVRKWPAAAPACAGYSTPLHADSERVPWSQELPAAPTEDQPRFRGCRARGARARRVAEDLVSKHCPIDAITKRKAKLCVLMSMHAKMMILR